MKKIFLLLVISSWLFVFASPVVAAKKRIRPQVSKPAATSTAISSARLRSDRKALLVTFLNLASYKSIDYTLTYTANEVDQGVQGSVAPLGGTTSRELEFGTCSKGVCTYHTNILGMRFVITAQTTSGKMVVKKYLIKP